MNSYQEEYSAVMSVIQNYSDGIYRGDVEQLKKAFSSEVILYGDIKEETYQKTLPEYLETIENRLSPKELNDRFDPKVMAVEIRGRIAHVKAHVPMLGYNYYDYLSLFKTEAGWKIVNKLFVHVE